MQTIDVVSLGVTHFLVFRLAAEAEEVAAILAEVAAEVVDWYNLSNCHTLFQQAHCLALSFGD